MVPGKTSNLRDAMFSPIKNRLALKYFLTTAVTVSLIFTLLYAWMARRHRQFVLEQIKKQAVVLHRQIVLTRQWVSDHNYVLIEKQGKVTSDPFLSDPDILDAEGRVYTKVTPAILTRELSAYAVRGDLYAFNLTNDHALNPKNRPDSFEQNAIDRFRSGNREGIHRIEMQGEVPVFRYAAPVIVRKSCLSCHDGDRYRPGTVGGCISVRIPVAGAMSEIRKNNLYLFLGMTALTASVVLLLFFTARGMLFKPIREIRGLTRKIREEALEADQGGEGDELRELADLCYLIDDRLKSQHRELERRIAEATRDLGRTNRDLARTVEELTRLNRTKTEFFTDISHEMRTPLTAIKGAADILARKNSCKDPHYLDIIRKNADHLVQTFVDILDYSRIEAGRLELEMAYSSVGVVARDAVSSYEALAAKRGVRLVVSSLEDRKIRMDARRIYQVLSNLLSNAIKFSPENGRVEVGVRSRGEWILVTVTDQGPGVPEAMRQAIFQKFYQVPQHEGAPDLSKGSSGIGLAICRALVEAHGGRIWVEGMAGKGTRFVFTLPHGQGKTGGASCNKSNSENV